MVAGSADYVRFFSFVASILDNLDFNLKKGGV